MTATVNYIGDQIILRKANMRDCAILLFWRNDELTRANSHESEFITKEQHEKWFLGSLQNQNRHIFIACLGENSIGMIRFDFQNESEGYLLSWTLDPASRGRGFGSKILSLACSKFSQEPLIAEIKLNNLPSRAMVKACGFRLRSTQDGVETWSRVFLTKSEHNSIRPDGKLQINSIVCTEAEQVREKCRQRDSIIFIKGSGSEFAELVSILQKFGYKLDGEAASQQEIDHQPSPYLIEGGAPGLSESFSVYRRHPY